MRMEPGVRSAGLTTARGALTEEAVSEFLESDQIALVGERSSVIFMQRIGGRSPLEKLEKLVDEVLSSGCEQIVLVASAAVTGLSHRHPGMVVEDQLPRVAQNNRLCELWRKLELSAEERVAASRGVVLTVLRVPSVLTSDAPCFPSSLFLRAFALRYIGFDPQIQLLSPRDLARAVERVVAARVGGVFHVAPRGTLSLLRALRIAKVRCLPFPRLGWITSFGARLLSGAKDRDELDLIRHPWTISDQKIEALGGCGPRATSEQALREFLERQGRRPRHPGAEGETSTPDPFGSDIRYMRFHRRLWLGFLSRFYWRIEVEGLENIPADGAAVLVGPHRGFMPFDGLMLVQLLRRRRGRVPRFLIHPTLVKFAFISKLMRGFGGVVACQENADQILRSGQILGVFPEGISGAFKLYKEAYELGRFGRPDYAKMAVRHQAPVVPFVVLGSAEVYPILGRIRWRWFRRLMEWPFLPIVPFPVPLPTKWHIKFLPPVEVPGRADGEGAQPETRVIREFHASLAGQIQAKLDDLRARRRSVFWGSVLRDADE